MTIVPIIFLVITGISFIVMGLMMFKCFIESEENLIMKLLYILNGLVLFVIGIVPFGIIYHIMF